LWFSLEKEKIDMPKIYIERRPDGNYAVQVGGNKRASAIEPRQGDAIKRSREMYPDVKPDVERQRHTDKGKPDQWRKA
jgi:hypothetical protein